MLVAAAPLPPAPAGAATARYDASLSETHGFVLHLMICQTYAVINHELFTGAATARYGPERISNSGIPFDHSVNQKLFHQSTISCQSI